MSTMAIPVPANWQTSLTDQEAIYRYLYGGRFLYCTQCSEGLTCCTKLRLESIPMGTWICQDCINQIIFNYEKSESDARNAEAIAATPRTDTVKEEWAEKVLLPKAQCPMQPQDNNEMHQSTDAGKKRKRKRSDFSGTDFEKIGPSSSQAARGHTAMTPIKDVEIYWAPPLLRKLKKKAMTKL